MSWRETLIVAGFKEFPVPQIGHEHATSAWQKRIRSKSAEPQDDDDAFVEVYHYEPRAGCRDSDAFQIECVFDRLDRQWMSVLLYSFDETELIAKLDSAINELVELRRRVRERADAPEARG